MHESPVNNNVSKEATNNLEHVEIMWRELERINNEKQIKLAATTNSSSKKESPTMLNTATSKQQPVKLITETTISPASPVPPVKRLAQPVDKANMPAPKKVNPLGQSDRCKKAQPPEGQAPLLMKSRVTRYEFINTKIMGMDNKPKQLPDQKGGDITIINIQPDDAMLGWKSKNLR